MNFDRYVGLPWASGGRSFDGVDCYGLVWLFYANELGIRLRSFAEAYDDAGARAVTSGLIAGQAGRWDEVGFVPGAVVAVRRGRAVSHVGIAVPGRRILHIERREGLSVIAPINGAVRVHGYFRPKVEA